MQVNFVSNVRDIRVAGGGWYYVSQMTKPLNAERLLEKGVNEWEKITATELNASRIH
jgi:hypothetical protein